MTVDDPVHRGDVPPPVDLVGHLREFARALVPALLVAVVVGIAVFGVRTAFAPKQYEARLVTEITPSRDLIPGDAFVEQMRAPFMGLAEDSNVLEQVLAEVGTGWDTATLSRHVELTKGSAPQILVFTATADSPELAEKIARTMVVTIAQAAFANHARDLGSQVDQVQAAITAEEARTATLAPEDPARAESERQLAGLRAQLVALQSSGGDQLTILASPQENTEPVSPQPVSEALVAALATLIVVAEGIVLVRGRIGSRPNRTWARRISRKYGAHFDPTPTRAGELDPFTSARLVQALRDGRPALLLVGENASAPASLTRQPGRFRTLHDAALSSHWWQRVNAGHTGVAVVLVSTAGRDRAAAQRALRQLADLGVPRNLVLQHAPRRGGRHATGDGSDPVSEPIPVPDRLASS